MNINRINEIKMGLNLICNDYDLRNGDFIYIWKHTSETLHSFLQTVRETGEGQQSIRAKTLDCWGNQRDYWEITPTLCMLNTPCDDHVEE